MDRAIYEVRRVSTGALTTAPEWDSAPWGSLPTAEISSVMGEPPAHKPRTEFRLGCDGLAIAGLFRVHDRYVRAVSEKHQDPVWRDSCVEFFFTPHDDPSRGYFNLEMNAGGRMLFRYQEKPRIHPVDIAPDDLLSVEILTTLPDRIDPEILEPVEWRLAFRVPLSLIRRYDPRTIDPAPGVFWRANLQKCADDTSHPHWLTWSPIPLAKPEFHRPDHFGVLSFA